MAALHPVAASLLADVEDYLATRGMSEASFGEAVLGDKHFLKQLRAGRDIRLSTERRVRRFMLDGRALVQ
jgi:hypothetical protein